MVSCTLYEFPSRRRLLSRTARVSRYYLWEYFYGTLKPCREKLQESPPGLDSIHRCSPEQTFSDGGLHWTLETRMSMSISPVMVAMPTELATQSTALQIPAQTVGGYRNQIVLGISNVSVKKPPSLNQSAVGCKTSTLPQDCWDFELTLAVLLMVLAGLLILLLLYWVLLLRHRLRVAQAGNALEYFGFYHMAQYDLKEPVPPLPPQGSSSAVAIPSLPSLPQPPSNHPPVHLTPPPLLYLPQPMIHTTPPSPHPSCGAGSDAEVYARIGHLRPSRPSSANQAQVILFEHSAL
ncbi:uncharacterized protein [Paramisgurnus dabryanus]|uniref:uncharacterized protein isoform X1 n=1 Tax=Paramisgurnus dabryanus TaxID=90735 RepID=UPI0031F4258E